MILHIFRTKVMNRGLNSKRLVKKIKKNGERPPSVPPRREEGLSKLRDCFAIACMEKSTIRSDGTFALALAGSDGGSAETGVWGYCLRYWEGVTACTCLKRREK